MIRSFVAPEDLEWFDAVSHDAAGPVLSGPGIGGTGSTLISRDKYTSVLVGV